MTAAEWDAHYWRVRSAFSRRRVYEGHEETQRDIARQETIAQHGPRPKEDR